MREIRGKFIEKIQRTETVESFRFRPLEIISFQPGQYVQVIFDEQYKSNRHLNKFLSLSCAPQKRYIEVTKRMSESEFSNGLRNLQQGDTVLFKGPMGNCVYKDEYRKIGFLIGGIGITAVISIIEYIFEKKLNTEICLLYSNRYEQDIPFKDELDAWHMHYPHYLHIIYLVTECKPKDTECQFGVINKDVVTNHMSDWQERVIFSFGPPGMVSAMKDICLKLSCPFEHIKTEIFTGY